HTGGRGRPTGRRGPPGRALTGEVLDGSLAALDALVNLVVVLAAGLFLGHLRGLVDTFVDLVAVLPGGVLRLVLHLVHHSHDAPPRVIRGTIPLQRSWQPTPTAAR